MLHSVRCESSAAEASAVTAPLERMPRSGLTQRARFLRRWLTTPGSAITDAIMLIAQNAADVGGFHRPLKNGETVRTFANQISDADQRIVRGCARGLKQVTDEKGWREFDAGGVTIGLHSGPSSPGRKGPRSSAARTGSRARERGPSGDCHQSHMTFVTNRGKATHAGAWISAERLM